MRLDIEIKKGQVQFKKDSRIKECFHYDKDSCSATIISAHSLQRSGVLNLLEAEVDGNLSVYSFLYPKYSGDGRQVGFEPIGKKQASTFFGFCGRHDGDIFKPIENYPVDIDNDEHCFLLSYRGFAKDYHAKYEVLKGFRENIEIQQNLPAELLEGLIEGSELGLKDSTLVKDRLNDMLERKAFDELEYLTCTVDHVVPFALASSINPNYSYRNEVLNKTGDPAISYEFVNFVVQPLHSGKTVILFSCLREHKKSIKFLDQLHKLNYTLFLKAVFSLAIAYVENTFFSPSVWNLLSTEEQQQLLYELQITIPSNRFAIKRFFHSKLNLFDEKYAIAIVRE